MTVQTVKLGRERFVRLREKDYRQLKAKANGAKAQGAKTGSKRRRLTAQDRGDIAEAKRREHEPSIPLEVVRKRLGL
jgi:hypothetical protein